MKQREFAYKFYHYSSYLNYILYWFEANLIFIVFNLPLILGMVGLKVSLATLPIYFLLGQTVLPSLYVLTRSLYDVSKTGSVIKTTIAIIRKDLLKVYRQTFGISVVLIIEFANLLLTSQITELHLLWWLNVILLGMTVTFVINTMIVLAAWPLTVFSAFKMTLKLSVVKSIRYYFNLIIIVSTFIALKIFSVYILLFGMSLAVSLCIANFRPIIKFVNSRPENKVTN